MRITIGTVALLLSYGLLAQAEQVTCELEWGFGPTPSEMYWDGKVQVAGGRIVLMRAVSFEGDRHDKMTPPSFQSFTLNKGRDGMTLVVNGGDEAVVTLDSEQGKFQWSIGQLKKELQVSFRGKDKGKLIVRIKQYLGKTPWLLSDKTTMDSDPAVCRLADGRFVILWRAFIGLASSDAKGGDQIRGVVLSSEGKIGNPFNLLERSGDVETIAVAPNGNLGVRAVWAEQRGRNWDLYTRSFKIVGDSIQRSEIVRLTSDPGVDKSPALAAARDGSLLLVWQGWREAQSSIFSQTCSGRTWGEVTQLSDGAANDWNPALAISKDGTVGVAWSSWRDDSYDVHLRLRSGGEWSPLLAVASTKRFEGHPSLVYDRAGTLWIAYEEGREGWGLDSHTAGLRSERNVRLRIYRNRQIQEPIGNAALKLPAHFKKRTEMAHLALDDGGALWLFFRRLGARAVWKTFGSSLGDEGWSPPVEFYQSAGGQDVAMATSELLAVWPSDHRTNQVGKEKYLYASFLPQRKGRRRRVEGKEAAGRIASPQATTKGARPKTTLAGRKLELFFGDLHRHTELSVCRTGSDGSVEDAFRYAIDAAGLDFLCVTDHVQHIKTLSDYDIWMTGKEADLHRVPGIHQPFYGYERSQRWPYGHRNVIGLNRYPKRVPRTADNRPLSANSGYKGEVRVSPPELWTRLVGQNVITIPHTSGNPVMGTDFGSSPSPMEPVVEIYQGCRISYEYKDAPDPRKTGKNKKNAFGGATKAGGFIWDALAKGYRYGFIASSDHAATHNSFACVWAESFANADILDALTQRRCYAATDKILCDVRMGGHIMGSEFTAVDVPPMEVRVVGTTDLGRIDVIKDNTIVFTHQPEKPSAEARFTFRDLDATPGTHYYYARVIQKDRNMAWVSPIWVKVGK